MTATSKDTGQWAYAIQCAVRRWDMKAVADIRKKMERKGIII